MPIKLRIGRKLDQRYLNVQFFIARAPKGIMFSNYLPWLGFTAKLFLILSYMFPSFAVSGVRDNYPQQAVFVSDSDQLDRALSRHESFIVARGEIAQKLIGALDERPNTTGNVVSIMVGIPVFAAYQLYAWFNETYGNIESVCEVDLDEVYFTEKGDKYVCEDETRKLPK
jgi:hypothetical protein